MLKRIAVLTLMGAALVCAKTYTFTVSDSAMAGAAQLKPGAYHLKVNGTNVILQDSKGHQVDTTAKLEPASHKYDWTAVATSTAGGTERIESIELGGSRTKVVFQ